VGAGDSLDGGWAGITFTARAGGRIFWATTLTMATGTLGMAVELLLGRAVVDRLMAAGQLETGAWALLAAVVAVAAVIAFTQLAGAGLHRMLAERVVRRAGADLLELTAACELAAFDRIEFHDRIRRAGKAAMASLQIAVAAPRLVAVAIGGGGLMIAVATTAPILVPIALLSGVPLLLASRANADSMYSFSYGNTPNDRERQQIEGVLKGRDQAAEVRVFGVQNALLERWNLLYDERIDNLWGVVRTYLRRSLASALAVAATLAVLAAGLGWLLADHRISLVGAATAAVSALILASQVQTAAASIGGLQESSQEFADYFDTTRQIDAHRERERALADAEPLGELTLRGVTFRYASASKPALTDIDLTIGAGEMVAVVGHNGSGKTTLAKLLCGLYEPEAGSIAWNGIPLASLRLGHQVGALFQTFARYWFSARDNISLSTGGDHDDLMALDGTYARMFTRQAAAYVDSSPDLST